MPSWDTIVSLKKLLDSYSEATGDTYILLVAQGNETTPRVIAKGMAAFPSTSGPNVLNALDSAAASIFTEIADYLGTDDGPNA
jgi:hypothetical protein